jgi:hypothetical protein
MTCHGHDDERAPHGSRGRKSGEQPTQQNEGFDMVGPTIWSQAAILYMHAQRVDRITVSSSPCPGRPDTIVALR